MNDQFGVTFSTQSPTLLSLGAVEIFSLQQGTWYWQVPLGTSARALVVDCQYVCCVDRDTATALYRVQMLNVIQRQVEWTIALSTSLKVFPVAANMDTVYIAEEQSDGIVLYALDKMTGSERWHTTLLNARISTIMGQWLPSVQLLGEVLIIQVAHEDTAGDNEFVALDQHIGDERWRLTRPATMSQPYSVTSSILVTTLHPRAADQHSEVLAVDGNSGNLIWSQVLNANYSSISSPTISASRCYFGVFSQAKEVGSLLCLDSGTGEFLWQTVIDAAIPTTPVIDHHHHLYIGARREPFLRSVTKIDGAYGRIQWRVAQVPPPLPPVPIGQIVLIGADTYMRNDPDLGQCVALNSYSGTLAWSITPLTYLQLTDPPRIASSGPGYHFAAMPKLDTTGQMIICASSLHDLLALDVTTGTKHWQLHTDAAIRWYELLQ